ncbi:7TM diverse intracellular signaling domain-containing protein [Oligoflexus tunisiensis]|uniref:7TM diverse intracellular signaling domain-containing protein n=1 Tax=Oligoflexus tunisiensis TaxID=708132 RepID=UPI000A5DD176|nr:7TM diverse intracellular signaling domain-containing protein [Oligoflexus tunisiensis]
MSGLSSLFALVLQALFLASAAFAAAPVIVQPEQDLYFLSRDVLILEDEGGSLGFEDIRDRGSDLKWFRFNGDIPNFGFSKSAYWLRFTLHNPTHKDQVWFLELAYPLHDHVDFYRVHPDGHSTRVSTGDRKPFHEREILHRTFIFRVDLPADSHSDFYLRAHSESSLQFPLNLWSPKGMAGMLSKQQFALGIYFGSMLVIALYNLFIYVTLRNALYLYYIIYIVSFGAFQFAISGLALQYLMPNHPDFASRFLPLVGSFAALWGTTFSRKFLQTDRYCPRLDRLIKFIWLNSLVFVGVALVAPYFISIVYGALVAAFLPPVLEVAAILAWRQGYRPARYFVLAFSALLVGLTLYHLSRLGIFPSSPLLEYGSQIGSLLEVILLSLALADKIKVEQSQDHLKIADLNKELEHHIANVEAEVEEKTRDIRSIMEHIPLGIFMIKPDQKVHRDHSQSFREMFAHADLERIEATTLLFKPSHLSADQVSQATSCVQATLGEDVLNFDVNSHALPQKLRRPGPDGTERFFDLTWNTIDNAEGKVDKILVTLRDVTDIRKLQERSQEQQEELEFISEILNVPTPRFLRFIQSCRDLLEENMVLVHSQGLGKKNFDILKMLFINMHTIKGSARALYLKKMTSVFHDLEQYYAQLQKNPALSWDLKKMERDLQEAEAIVSVYERIAREKLGRSTESHRHVEFHVEQVESAYRGLAQAVEGQTLPDEIKVGVNRVLSLFHQKMFRSAQEILEDVCASLPALARDLQKDVPVVTIEVDRLLMSDKAEELIRHAFVHLLRNTMDHGIESPEERARCGKSRQGNITILMERHGTRVIMIYRDDGRGLDLARLREIGLARQLLPEGGVHRPEEIADLIFHSGLSTANQLTDISGRGVGMDAVRRFIHQAGGTLRIVLLPQGKAADHHRLFQLVIDLPFELFEQAKDHIELDQSA